MYVGDAEEDRAGLVSECNKDGKRTQSYVWKRPMICDKTTGVPLPADKVVPCRGCTRGQHRHPKTDKCVFCDEGEYQANDNHDGKGYKIKDCKKCGPGHYAPKKLEFSFFEEMPVQFHASCSEANDLGKAHNCDLMQGWHVNLEQQLDSGVGIPQGQKLLLKVLPEIESPVFGGFVSMDFKMRGFGKNEQLRIGIDGVT